MDHQRTETGLKPRLQVWHILGPRSLLESQTHEILVVIAVSDPAASPEKKPRSKTRTLEYGIIFGPSAPPKETGDRRLVFFLSPVECSLTLANTNLSQERTHLLGGERMYRDPFVYQTEAIRVDLTNVRCLRGRTTLVL